MSEPFLAEVKLVSFNFPPRGWAFCNGQILAIAQNQALFSLLGTTYGGNGQTTFALPDLRGRTPVHTGSGFALGQRAGEINHTLITTEMPAHNHFVNASSANADSVTPVSNYLGVSTQQYTTTGNPNTPLDVGPTPSGGNQPHSNMQPYLVVNFVIALQGIFPSRN